MRLALLILVTITVQAASPARSQQVLETSPEAGRIVIDGPLRAINPQPPNVGIGYEEKVVYVLDLEEPEGVMAFSLATGELVRTISIRRGDGPAELRWITSITPASDGGIYVSGGERVLEFDSRGRLESSWSVIDITGRNICELDGQPAVINEEGNLVRRGRNEEGTVVGDWSVGAPNDALMSTHYRTVVACTGGAAYVMAVPESGLATSFTVLRQTRPAGRLRLPPEFQDGRKHQVLPSVDGRGNIVLVSMDNEFWGAVIDPDTGCYAVLRNSGGTGLGEFRGIYADSALVLHRDYEESRDGVRRVIRVFDAAARVSLIPFRRVSGDPCPGMFPSLDDGVPRPAVGG